MNESLYLRKQLRRTFGSMGWTLLIYMLLMNICVSAAAFVQSLIRSLQAAIHGGFADPNEIAAAVMNNGWGYILCIAIGIPILFLWKKKDFMTREIWKKEAPMTAGSFFSILSIFLSAQLLFQLLGNVLEVIFNLFGLSVTQALEMATFTGSSVSMLLYVGILAPITEEILFRGLIMRTFAPYGKKFAVVASAFLFGIFHGNLVQSPFAFALGLVLGYTAMEYSLVWSIALHMFNNLVLGIGLEYLTGLLPVSVQPWILTGILVIAFIASVIILIVRRKDVSAYLRNKMIARDCTVSFFSSAGILTITILEFIGALFMIRKL